MITTHQLANGFMTFATRMGGDAMDRNTAQVEGSGSVNRFVDVAGRFGAASKDAYLALTAPQRKEVHDAWEAAMIRAFASGPYENKERAEVDGLDLALIGGGFFYYPEAKSQLVHIVTLGYIRKNHPNQDMRGYASVLSLILALGGVSTNVSIKLTLGGHDKPMSRDDLQRLAIRLRDTMRTSGLMAALGEVVSLQIKISY